MTSTQLTPEQKLQALKALTRTHLEMRSPGDWYVSAYDRKVVKDQMLHGNYGNGKTPEEAINNDWSQIAETFATIRVGVRDFRWNGFMWDEVTIKP